MGMGGRWWRGTGRAVGNGTGEGKVEGRSDDLGAAAIPADDAALTPHHKQVIITVISRPTLNGTSDGFKERGVIVTN